MDFQNDPSLVLNLPLCKMGGSSFTSQDAYKHLCTVTGALWRLDGRHFDGSDDIVSVADSSALRPASVTFIAWYKTDNTGSGRILTMPYNVAWTAPYEAYSFLYDHINERFSFYTNTGGTRRQLHGGISSLSTGTWYCVACTLTNGSQIPYVNAAIYTTPTAYVGDITYSGSPLLGIGARTPSAPAEFVHGTIGEVQIYNRALTPQEIQRNYLATKWRYR